MHRTPSGSGLAPWPLFSCAAHRALAAVHGLKEKKTELGQGGSVVTGSAGPQGAQNAARELVRCDAPVATLALAENPNGYIMGSGYQLPASPVPLVKLLAQQSGCFRVVDRAAGLKGTVQEQELKDAGILRKNNSTVAKGKGYEAQYTLTPSLTFSEQDAGRGLAGVIAMIPVLRDIAGLAGLVEQVKFKEAQTALLLSDNETTEQVAAATGSARTTDLGVGGLVFGKLGGAAGAGWSNTNEGKVIAAAFLDAHNQLVVQARGLKAQQAMAAAGPPRPYKLPESVLVVIHTPALEVLLIRRTGGEGHWQSVTGSKDALDEPFAETARREVAEETGIDTQAPGCLLTDWALENVYDIWPQWLHRYAPGVVRNRERVFGLRVPAGTPVVLSPREHDAYEWLPWQQAADRCFSASNAEACLLLPRFLHLG
eukprot:gene9807-9872_t